MESLLRAALLQWLKDAPDLANLNAIEEESPIRTSPPWLGFAATAATDWGTKDREGREVRIAIELLSRGDDPTADLAIIKAIESRVQSLPSPQDDFEIVTARFLRSRAEQRSNNRRAMLIEFRFRILATPTE